MTDWELYSYMELAEMWFESRGIGTRRTKVDDEWVLIATLEIGGVPDDFLLHKAELESRADDWMYENE